MEKNGIIELHYKWYCNEWDIGGKDKDTIREGTIEAIVGECENIEGFPRLRIVSVSDDKIRIEWINSIQDLTPGSFIVFNHKKDGHEDHDGVLWNSWHYSLKIFWDN